jgi:hypothetical protein
LFLAEEKEEARAKKEAERAEKEAERQRREEQLKELNEKDIERPGEKEKRKSRPFSFGGVFGSKRKSSQPARDSAATAPADVGTEVPGSRRSSTSLESSSSEEEGAAVATHSENFKGKAKESESDATDNDVSASTAPETHKEEETPKKSDVTSNADHAESLPPAGTATDTKLEDPPKHTEPVESRVAIHTGPGKTETTITSAGKQDDQTEKEQGKKPNWFKRLSRRASKPAKPDEKSLRDTKTPGTLKKDNKDSTKDGNKASTTIAEPATGLPKDISKENPAGHGTDQTSHASSQPATTTDNADEGLATSTATGESNLTSATLNPATESVSSPAEATIAQAQDTSRDDEDSKLSHAHHMPTAPDTEVGEFLPAELQPTGKHIDRIDSERDVALAGKTRPSRSRSTSLSSTSSDVPTTTGRGRPDLRHQDTNESSTGEEFQEAQEAQDTLNTADLPMPAFAKARGSSDSPHRETRFKEEL